MKYLVRSIKYFFYFSIICTLIITALVLIGAVEGNVDAIFEEGYRSVIKIAIFFLLVAAVYPKLEIDKSWNEIRETAVNYMAENHYEIESETPDMVTFRIKGTVGRLTKMYEDRITFTRTGQGWNLEGLRKDAFRLASGLENRLSLAFWLPHPRPHRNLHRNNVR